MLPSSESYDLAELQLEQELRQMFELDSQKDLETYFACVEQLSDWAGSIQKMYRAIHTIKGGSVTVKADAILHIATVLEDLLSDLRYVETAPISQDGQLQQMLLEAGEILASVMGTQDTEQALAPVTSKVERIQKLHQQIQQNYLSDWSEQTQFQKEFAEQGFDLVVLDLEIALGQLPETGTVPETTLMLAQQLVEELRQIGNELELADGWSSLLDQAQQLQAQPDVALWRSQWQQLFQTLKTCAYQGGEVVSAPTVTELADVALDPVVSQEAVSLDEIDGILDKLETTTEVSDTIIDEVDGILNNLEEIETSPEESDTIVLDEIDEILDNLEQVEASPKVSALDAVAPDEINTILDNLEQVEASIETKASKPLQAPVTENIQIPVPLSRLDNSAKSIVETLLAARATESFYQNLHRDLLKLIAIASDSVQYITQLRKIQDDYAGLNQLEEKSLLQPNTSSSIKTALNIEKYHKGYVTINRLLENSLRLTEIGTEAEQTAQKTAERLKQLNNHILKLKDIVEDSRLVPFRNIAFRVRAILRDLINRYNKSVELKVVGEQIELDVGTARHLEPILLHLVRNAYDHGIETPEARLKAGKPEAGKLTLTLERLGSSYLLQLQDDGKGIDSESIRSKAQKLGLPLIQTNTPQELLSVICQPGFSSQTEVSEISGRGVGMDVVATQITLLGGYLSLETKMGQGTTFKMSFPVPHLLVPCMLVQAGNRSFAIPTEQVVTTAILESLQAHQITNDNLSYGWEIKENERIIPGLDLLAYWSVQSRHRSLSSNAIAVLIRTGQSEIWLLGDRLLGQLELQIQPLPSPMTAPQGLIGVGLQADGSLMPVLEASALIDYVQTTILRQDGETTPESATEIVQSSQPHQPTILIVDDAALMRRRIEASLSAYGYITHTCADGLEAWNWLQKNPHPVLVITDIEMPHMDGFTLIDRCRQADLTFPILVVSSRLAEEWSSESRRLGATDYLTKGFSTSELINKVNALVN